MLVVFYYTATLVAVAASYKAAVVEFRTDSNNLNHRYVQNNLIGFENVLKGLRLKVVHKLLYFLKVLF